MSKLMIHGVEASGTYDSAKNIKLDTPSGMRATNVQDGINELNSN